MNELLNSYQILLDNTDDFIYSLDLESRHTAVNKNVCKALNLEAKDIIGKNHIELGFPEKVVNEWLELHKKVFSTREILKTETITIMPDGILHYYEIILVPIFDNQKNVIGIRGSSRDITSQKILQEQLLHSEKLAAIGQLAAGIAHEFNNILAIIYNNAQLMQYEEYKNSPDLVKTIELATQRGAGIVANMMAFAKPLTPKKEETKIEDIIEDVLNIQKQQMILEHIEIDRNYEHTEKVLIDAGQFQQVFLNLIINARHAIQPKGKGKIFISAKTNNKNLEIKIADDGIGIEQENLKNIFNPFFSTKGAWARNNHGIKGTGLGLSVTHTIIKNHNGKIRVESEKDKGATFIIELPISEEQIEVSPQEADKIANEKIESKVLNVLIVDDEESIITSMTRLFRINNCEVKNSVSGLEGLKLASEIKFDVIFLDMLLPDISGENIFKEIRKFDKDVPIVFISGQIGLEVEKLKELGAHAFIQKPFSMDAVNKILTEIRTKI